MSDQSITRLLEDAPVGVFLIGDDHRIRWVNAKVAAMLGAPAESLVGVDMRTVVTSMVPRMAPDTADVADRILASFETPAAEPTICHLLEQGEQAECWVEHSVHPIAGGGGWIAFCTDITDRMRAEAAAGDLELAVEDQRMILENMAGFTYRHDLEGVFHYLSPSVERITGYTVDEWKLHYTAYLTDNPINDKVVENTEETLETGKTNAPYKVELFHRDGTRVMLEVNEQAYYENGEVAGIVGIALDITEQQLLETRLQHIQKLQSMGVLAGGVAHDFNNLLMAILGNAGLALDELAPGSPAHEHLQDIVRTSRRAAEVCQQMLAYSGKGTTRLEALDLSRIASEMASMLEVSISKKVRLVYDLGEDLPAALGDPTQVRQVVLNLITNASEAIGDEPGAVRLTTGAGEFTRAELKAGLSAPDPIPGTYVWLEVEDTGTGMDPETLKLIFDPFFTTKFAGRGLGLSTVLGIMRGHEGAIRIWSRAGKGTRFRVLFPAAETAAVEEPDEPRPQSTRPSTGLVLLVDDEPALRKVGSRMLEKLGFEVLTASDGRAGLDLFEERGDEILFCVLDMTMPEMSGDEVFRAMREQKPDVNVLLTSGYDAGEAAKRMGRGIRYEFIQKPFSQEALAIAVADLLSGGRNAR